MNLILLNPNDLTDDGHVCITDPRRLTHLRDVHRSAPGDLLTVGVQGGDMGKALLKELTAERAYFQLEALNEPPPTPLPVHLVLALPRPRMLARTLEHVTALGVKEITLLHTKRVEKSYWQSPELRTDKIHQHLVLGLEQARDTRLPSVTLSKGFRPFLEKQLPELLSERRGLVAHPGMPNACPRGISDPTLLLVGPEGGFIAWEVEQLMQAGCEGMHLGPRILRVETAVTALLSRLF
ncbi:MULTISPECIES: 16S rRNA (uracil(1498)-N(3))-methyltransferase [unclassified Halomonas]|uniref:16S rRNA (uracil(1498)-N(3))-methyltransferase n=1 Tax=unclassified Halomonas TaxID=2609666 RepID=UPI0007D91C26|nr:MULTISPECIES: 16S rRNA (uracil(1498)-N(3))-methyltransferase [unclassified Halomonas]MBT2785421.1 16S rRNA (uracil(1498)-N(3))-methyltransferase [Halomonas sp. ISL-106]MBT2797895.1 16S rRNA (uracil(1498)-N(3))-methyltransferase [Halomonas sp. ISL-104]OAL59274.1 16S rRNA (uracil(1498)-N(3))-methyltransferase [Halomonas sp. ALS9]